MLPPSLSIFADKGQKKRDHDGSRLNIPPEEENGGIVGGGEGGTPEPPTCHDVGIFWRAMQ
jgi:hypothetical protein